MIVSKLSFELRAAIRKAAFHLTGFKRRFFVAEVAIDLKLGTQHDLEKAPSDSASFGRYLSTSSQTDQRRVRADLRAITAVAITC